MFNRMMFYGSTVDAVTAPDSVRDSSVRYLTLYQVNTANQCDYTLYVFKPSKAQNFYVKKFTVTYWQDTTVTESRLVELSSQLSARLDRYFRQTSHFLPQPYSVHFGPDVNTKAKSKDSKNKDYWRIEVLQNAPYQPYLSRWAQRNAYFKDPVNKGLVFGWRKARATHRLRSILQDFTSCP